MREILIKTHDFYWANVVKLWRWKRLNTGTSITNTDFSIGIVTYVDRYERFFKPLIGNLVTLFPDTQIIIAINGYYNPEIQRHYLKNIREFLKQFRNVHIVEFYEPQSLSKLWNLLIINSQAEKTLILNDDIKIAPWFRKNIEKPSILSEKIMLINRSWSHFFISKEIIKQNGWFDERFPGVGNEDEDYECRLAIAGLKVPSFRVSGLKNVIFKTTNFSYGKNVDVVNSKYVKKNKLFFDSKWTSIEVPKEGYTYVRILQRYVRLEKGMETPRFYDFSILNKQLK